MPDRFANGDPANDDPARSRGLLDRGQDALLPRRRPAGDHRPPALPEGPRRHRASGSRPSTTTSTTSTSASATTAWPSPTTTATARWTSTRWTSTSATWPSTRELVDAAHGAGIKVIQDQVANHTGPYHPWVADPPDADLVPRHAPSGTRRTPGRPGRSPIRTRRRTIQRETLDGWFIDILPDLNQDDPGRAALPHPERALVGGHDGPRRHPPGHAALRAAAVLAEWRAALQREYPKLTVLGEMFDGDPALVSFFQGGGASSTASTPASTRCSTSRRSIPLRRAFAEGKPLRELAVMLAHDHLYPRRVRARHLLRPARRGALHERAGGDRRRAGSSPTRSS